VGEGGADERMERGRPTSRSKPRAYDGDLIDRLLVAIDEGERGWSSFLADADAPTYAISYEELADNSEGLPYGCCTFSAWRTPHRCA
jgi:LPS sulfotransferase NodH